MLYLFNLIGAIVFLFIFWRKLKEDYLGSHIFTTGFYILIFLLASLLLSRQWLPEWWFWMEFLAVMAGFIIGVWRFKMRFYEVFEAVVVSILPWLALVFFADSARTLSWFSFSLSVHAALFVFFYGWINKKYKDFAWYRSGRVGFAGLSTLAFYLLTRGLLAVAFPFMLSFVGKFETLVSAAAAFICFIVIFNLSRQS